MHLGRLLSSKVIPVSKGIPHKHAWLLGEWVEVLSIIVLRHLLLHVRLIFLAHVTLRLLVHCSARLAPSVATPVVGWWKHRVFLFFFFSIVWGSPLSLFIRHINKIIINDKFEINSSKFEILKSFTYFIWAFSLFLLSCRDLWQIANLLCGGLVTLRAVLGKDLQITFIAHMKIRVISIRLRVKIVPLWRAHHPSSGILAEHFLVLVWHLVACICSIIIESGSSHAEVYNRWLSFLGIISLSHILWLSIDTCIDLPRVSLSFGVGIWFIGPRLPACNFGSFHKDVKVFKNYLKYKVYL